MTEDERLEPGTTGRPSAPPSMEFLLQPRPAAGEHALRIEMGEVRIELAGLDTDLARTLFTRFHPYTAVTGEGGDALRVAVVLEDRDYFLTPPAEPEMNPVLLECDGSRVRYLGYRVAGWFDTHDGRGELLLARGDYEPPERAIENYVRAAVAWQAASRGGALVHAAGAVFRDRGYLFFGPSGAGKSTLSASNRRARVVSDDLSLVLPGANGLLHLVGSPFRGTYEGGPPVTGRFPLAAGFRLVQDTEASVRPAPRVRVFAELVANLPFVADSFSRRPDLFEQMEKAFAAVPLHHLHFARDDTYWDAIVKAGL